MRQNRLGLIIPDQTNDTTEDLSLNAIETWHSGLKIADLADTANKLLTMLTTLNTNSVQTNDRTKILELFHPLANSVYQHIKKACINRTRPLAKAKIKQIEQCKTIEQEMFNGYKLLLETVAPEILPNIICSTLKHCNNILTICYDLYIQPPENLWREMHILYKYANDSGVATNYITPYQYAIFIAATNPYQWRHAEQELWHKCASLWENYIVIRSFKDKDAETNGVFIIPTDLDLAPMPASSTKNNINNINNINDSKNKLSLDLTGLLDYFNKNSINNIEIADTENTKYSLQKLINYLNHDHSRKLKRFNILGQVNAALGFLSTHYHINNKQLFKPEEVGTDTKEAGNDEFQLTADTLLDEFSFDNPKHNVEMDFKADTHLYKCNLINIHSEGAAIKFKDIAFPPIQPGELIAMTIATSDEVDSNETHWNIGTIRWLKHDLENNLTAGLQILAPFAIAGAVQLLKKDKTMGFFQRALLIHDDNSNDKTAFNIITPVMQFETGKKVKIYSYYHKQFIETDLKDQVEEGNSNYKRFGINLELKEKDESGGNNNKKIDLMDL